MRPPSVGLDDKLIKKCELETQKLFEFFLDVSKYDSKETNEVQYQVRERDSQVRSGSFGSTSSLNSRGSNISLRGVGEDVANYQEAIERKRRSIEIPDSRRYGSSPSICSSFGTVEADSAHSPLNFTLGESPPNRKYDVKPRPKSSDIKRQRPPSGPPTFESFQSEGRRSRSNTGPSEERLMETAKMIAGIGDKIEKEHEERLGRFQTEMVSFLAENATISYEVFAAHVNDLVGQDRNWTNLVFIFHLGRRVVQSSYLLGTQTRSYFGRFLGNAFGHEIAHAGSADQYVREHSTTPTKSR